MTDLSPVDRTLATRRLRTQAERDADGTTWRATAHTRPGYATYPNTPAGDPSWWRRSSPSIAPECSTSHPQLHADCDGCGCSCHRPPAVVAGPPPADGETCVKWCGFCHLNTGGRPPAFDPQTMSGTRYAQQLRDAGITLDEMERVVREDIWMTTEPIAPSAAPPLVAPIHPEEPVKTGTIPPGSGCPICGYDFSTWSLIGQMAHVVTAHSWWQRIALRRRSRLPLAELLIIRKYRHKLRAYTDRESA